MYTLVNAPVLARDLVRHPRGAAVATDLLRALALDDDALASLDQVRVAADAQARRDAATVRMAAEPRALQVLAAARDVATTAGLTAWTAAADVLDAAALGGLEELVGFVRDELLDAAWWRGDDISVARWPTALDVVADGVTATYAVDACGSLVAPLGRPWRRWLSSTGHGLAGVDGPAAGVLEQLDDGSPQRLRVAAETLRRQRADGWSWAEAMHEACWAVHLTGRERLAAAAQLHAVRILLGTGTAGTRPGADVVAAVVAAVHAAVVADVLHGDVAAALSAPFGAAVG
jgi:hypothetical protein